MHPGNDKRHAHILALLVDEGSRNRNGCEESARVIERLRYAHDRASKRAGAIKPLSKELGGRAHDNAGKRKREQALHAVREHNVGAHHSNGDEQCEEHESCNVQVVLIHISHRDADRLA